MCNLYKDEVLKKSVKAKSGRSVGVLSGISAEKLHNNTLERRLK